MTDKPDKYPSTADLRACAEQTGFNTAQMARYMGVRPNTYSNWIAERRQMPTVAERLLTVLNLLRTIAPELHSHFVPPPVKRDMRKKENWSHDKMIAMETRYRKPRGRLPK